MYEWGWVRLGGEVEFRTEESSYLGESQGRVPPKQATELEELKVSTEGTLSCQAVKNNGQMLEGA